MASNNSHTMTRHFDSEELLPEKGKKDGCWGCSKTFREIALWRPRLLGVAETRVKLVHGSEFAWPMCSQRRRFEYCRFDSPQDEGKKRGMIHGKCVAAIKNSGTPEKESAEYVRLRNP